MNQEEMDDFMSNAIARINNKKLIEDIISNIMNINPDYRVGLRRRLVIINKIKSAILISILERQNKIIRKHCK